MAKKKKAAACQPCRLNPKALACTFGLVWGFGLLILGLVATYTGFGSEFIALFGSVYLGFKATVSGSFIGGIWAFIDGFIGGYVIAWLYNKCC